jgi:hypothetical protein
MLSPPPPPTPQPLWCAGTLLVRTAFVDKKQSCYLESLQQVSQKDEACLLAPPLFFSATEIVPAGIAVELCGARVSARERTAARASSSSAVSWQCVRSMYRPLPAVTWEKWVSVRKCRWLPGECGPNGAPEKKKTGENSVHPQLHAWSMAMLNDLLVRKSCWCRWKVLDCLSRKYQC